MKLEYLWGQLANVDHILYEASLGWGKDCIRFWDRLDQNLGFHGNRKRPLTYNWENNVATFSRLFLVRFFLYLQVTRTCIRSQTSLNFGQIGPLTMELLPLSVGKISHILIMGKWCLPASSLFFIGSSSNLLVTRRGMKSQTSSKSSWIRLVTSELRALVCELNFQ